MKFENINQLAVIWLPLFTLGVLLLIEIFATREFRSSLVNENGPLEILQFLVLILACFTALYYLLRTRKDVWKFIPFLLVSALAGCIYVAGEEISWGQHFFGWETPESWRYINDQQETNLHNTTSWLDQKPRLLLEIGVIVGGLLLPLLKARKPSVIPGWLKDLTPPVTFGVIAVCFLIVKTFDKIGDMGGISLFARPAEITELYIYFFILLYLIFLGQKFVTAKPRPA